MNNKHTLNILKRYEQITRKMDELYHKESASVGLSDCAGMILYALSMSDTPMNQTEIRKEISMPKQTVNSVLKKMEGAGIIEYARREDRRCKDILLTCKGKTFANNTAGKMIKTMCKAFSELSETEQEEFLRLYEKLAVSFEAEIANTRNQE